MRLAGYFMKRHHIENDGGGERSVKFLDSLEV